MLIPNHPHDERLAALASGEAEAAADASLSQHLTECPRCTGVVEDLRLLTTSLAELPDIPPHRPLRLLPEVTSAPSRADRLGGWARRFFAPAVTAGAALAMVGLVGTTAPLLNNFAATGGAATQEEQAFQDTEDVGGRLSGGADAASSESPDGAEAAPGDGQAAEPTTNAYGAEQSQSARGEGGEDTSALSQSGEPRAMALDEDRAASDVPAERSPWPMVLFSGVAVMIAAALLRWILVPRAG